MLIHITARYQVRRPAVQKCVEAVGELVAYVQKNEPKTLFYLANQEVLDPTQFLHILVFEDEMALKIHQNSPASAQFVKTVYPEAVKPLEFMEYNIFASKTENLRS